MYSFLGQKRSTLSPERYILGMQVSRRIPCAPDGEEAECPEKVFPVCRTPLIHVNLSEVIKSFEICKNEKMTPVCVPGVIFITAPSGRNMIWFLIPENS